MTISRSTLALARSAKNINGRQYIMYSACQVRKMTVDNLGPTASGMNFGKYSAQNDVCSSDYSTSVRLIKTETDKAFQLLYCLPYC